MEGWIGAAVVAGVFAVALPASAAMAAAAPLNVAKHRVEADKATDFGARRYYRRYYVYRPHYRSYYRPYYYARPYYYRPYPYYAPAPFTFGVGF